VPRSRSGAERAIRAAVEEVADALGNTAAVCRSSYIDPRVFDRFRAGERIDVSQPRRGRLSTRGRAQIERAVLELID
jgi:DNA topoisomerase IB